MVKHGWKEGQSLGNRDSIHVGLDDTERLAAARVGVLFKDDNLGLGAKRKGKDIEAQRTGLDAFQGLLGRLNGKSDVELEAQEKKVEERRLEMYMRGRWGGMVFVKGGVLVGDEKDKDKDKGEEEAGEKEETSDTGKEVSTPATQETSQDSVDENLDEKQKRKQERRQRKEDRRRRREQKALRKAAKQAKRSAQTTDADADEDEDDDASGLDKVQSPQTFPKHKSPLSQPPDEPVSSRSSSPSSSPEREAQPKSTKKTTTPLVPQSSSHAKPRGGRHLLRGRNIQAKKMAFADLKGLNEIFMR